MSVISRKLISAQASRKALKCFSVSAVNHKLNCKLLVVGGGGAGCATAAKFARRLGKNAVIVLEPSPVHYYQPLLTLVGAGDTPLAGLRAPTASVLPKRAHWVQDEAAEFDPDCCTVTTKKGDVISYEYMVVATGVKFDYHKVKGLKEALDDPCSGVSTIYAPEYATKTWENLREFKGGDALFTMPIGPIKCPGAPQKIAYLADSYMRKNDVRSKANISYLTSMSVIFGVKKYADALDKVAARKGINVCKAQVLVEVRPDRREADFKAMAGPEVTTMTYDMLCATPPMSPPDCLQRSKLVTATGYLDVDKHTLQHTQYANVFGIGDCTNTPNSKTLAAAAVQVCVLESNLSQVMRGAAPTASYNGYGACPLLTSYNQCILAEFDYNLTPLETMPFDQSKERYIHFAMKKHLFPFIYWSLMIRGYYNGPTTIRNLLNRR